MDKIGIQTKEIILNIADRIFGNLYLVMKTFI